MNEKKFRNVKSLIHVLFSNRKLIEEESPEIMTLKMADCRALNLYQVMIYRKVEYLDKKT